MYKLTTKWFARWAKKEHISDEMLLRSIRDLENELSSVSLGSGLYKVRVASCDSGKSSSYRTIIIPNYAIGYHKLAPIIYNMDFP